MREIKWENLALAELGSVSRGKSKHRPRNDKKLYGGDYPFIQTADVKNANFYINEFSQTYNDVGLIQSKLWEKDTLCITIAANIAETALLSFPACFPDSIVGFIPFENISDVRYIKYTLDNYKTEFQKRSKGATQDNLSVSKINSLKLLVPDYYYQVKVADVISRYDLLIENNQKRIVLLEEMAQRLYTEWFVKFKFPGYEKVKMVDSGTEYGIVPDGWQIKKIEEVITRVSAGKRYEKKEIQPVGKIPILDQGKSGTIGFHNNSPDVMASIDDPVIVFANHTCYQRLIIFNFSSIQNVLPYKPKDADIFWMHWATKSTISISDYKGHWPVFISKQILIPEIELTKRFGYKVKTIVLEISYLESYNKLLMKMRDLYIDNLITGKRLIK